MGIESVDADSYRPSQTEALQSPIGQGEQQEHCSTPEQGNSTCLEPYCFHASLPAVHEAGVFK